MTNLLSGNKLNGINYNNHNNLRYLNNAILYEIEKCKALTQSQIRLLFYSNQKQGKLLCQNKLTKLVNKYYKGYLHRIRFSSNQNYIYFVEKIPTKQLEHLIYTNWVYIRNMLRLRLPLNSHVELFHFEYTKDYDILIHDGFMGLHDTKRNVYDFSFIEVDLSHNLFDKVKKYNLLREDESKWIHTWWGKLSRYQENEQWITPFPSIRVVTNRKKKVLECIEQENRNGLDFKVFTTEEMDGKIKRSK